MSILFSQYHFPAPNGGIDLDNRLIVAPMCQYSSIDGVANDWHLTHWTNLMNSGAGAFIIEATAVTEEGRITPYCLGIYNDATAIAIKDILARARLQSAPIKVGIQLAHAGRKSSSHTPWDGGALIPPNEDMGWQTLAPSEVPHNPKEPAPESIDAAGLLRIKQGFVDAARRSHEAGFDFIEIHAAHGYLIHQFLSPLANKRTDEYGGSLENRMRYPLEVLAAIREVYEGVLGVRISATDWAEGGWDLEQCLVFCEKLKALNISYIHVSSGGVAHDQKIAIGPGYQVSFAKKVKELIGLPTIAVGLITEPQQAETILQNQEADCIALARAFLYQPRWGWQAAAVLDGQVFAAKQYWRCLPREHQNVFKSIKIGQR
ncbi:MAG: NADH:flavin oxidoreductase/NADH oxidase [Betaproteobacteria bacterium]|jgi:2,4-dienoyl-CoA reductase-like NADH-dependent reductase (Old Yellow Enzyme family)